MDCQIRKMNAGDTEEVYAMMQVFYATDAVLTNGSPEIFLADIAACTGDSPYAEGYVFMREQECIGYAMLAKSFSTEFGKPCIWIEDLYIKPSYRQKGVGTAFFQMLFATYKGVIFRLEAEGENQNAIAVYEKNGFITLPYLEMFRKGEALPL